MAIRELQQMRIALEISQGEVCRRAALSSLDQPTLSQAETGRINLSQVELGAIESALLSIARDRLAAYMKVAPEIVMSVARGD